MTRAFAAFLVLSALLAGACAAKPDASASAAAAEPLIIWRPIGTWSGHGNAQTESFTSETGSLRIRWETSDERPDSAGSFRLIAHSAISGRPLEQVVEQRGAGSGTGYVGQDPRVFYLVVESTQLKWKFSVEEGFAAEAVKTPKR